MVAPYLDTQQIKDIGKAKNKAHNEATGDILINVDADNYFYLDSTKYSPYTKLFSLSGSSVLIIKKPYLRRSYQSKRKVSEILAEAFPKTMSRILFVWSPRKPAY